MASKSRLGKGLDALIPPSDSQINGDNLLQVPIEQISLNPQQPRSVFDADELAELADSIKAHGVIQPLIVRQDQAQDQFTLIAGERRLQAAKLAHLAQVPVVLREANEQELLELALVENVQRSDLSPLESAEAFRHLHQDFNLSHKEIAEKVGKSRVAVTNTMALLELSLKVREALATRKISEGHGRAIHALESDKAQESALSTVLQQALNVRQTEELVRKLQGRRKKSKSPPVLSPEMQSLQDQLRDSLGTKVKLNPSSKGGKILLHYYSDEELNALVDKLLKS